MADENKIVRPYYYKLERQKFACVTYALAALFLILAFIQWCILYFIVDARHYFIQNCWLGITSFLLSLLLTLIFIFFDALRFYTPINWIFTVLIFECLVVGLTTLVVRHYKYQFIMSFIIWVTVLLLFLIIGSFIPHDLTIDIVVLVIFGIISLIGAIYFLMLQIVTNVAYSLFVSRGFIVISVCMFIMYHAQIINGGRFAEIRDHDYLLAALIVFYDFILLYLFTFQLAAKWSDPCDIQKDKNNLFVLDHHLSTTTPGNFTNTTVAGLASDAGDTADVGTSISADTAATNGLDTTAAATD